jgi:hypothetical protein
VRFLALLVFAAAQLCLAQRPADSARESAFKDLVLGDLRRAFPTDAELGQRLEQRRRDFEQLVAKANADKELVRVAHDFTWTTSSMAWLRPASELGFSVQRWDEYRRLFHSLGVEAGFLRPWDHPDAIYLIVQTKGLVTGGPAKGYAYSETALLPRCESLDKLEAVGHTETCFKPLGGKWYLYLQQD